MAFSNRKRSTQTGYSLHFNPASDVVKKYFKIFGWICLGIFLQFKFSVLYGIVFLENLNFHERTYYVRMHIPPSDENVRLLQVETVVHHSLGPDYFANIYIPESYKVLNKKPYLGAEAIKGYQAYKMGMKRKYRDVLAKDDLIITPVQLKADVPSLPVLVHFENMKQRLHIDKTYKLALLNKSLNLEGPREAAATYPQRLGL